MSYTVKKVTYKCYNMHHVHHKRESFIQRMRDAFKAWRHKHSKQQKAKIGRNHNCQENKQNIQPSKFMLDEMVQIDSMPTVIVDPLGELNPITNQKTICVTQSLPPYLLSNNSWQTKTL